MRYSRFVARIVHVCVRGPHPASCLSAPLFQPQKHGKDHVRDLKRGLLKKKATGIEQKMAKLKEKLPNSQTWSNGNLVRSLTLLAVTYSEQNKCELQDALKPEVLKTFVPMLTFARATRGVAVNHEPRTAT